MSKGFYMCYNVLQANGEKKDSSQMIIPVENRTCPSGLEVGSFRNLPRPNTHTCCPGEAALSATRWWTGGQDMPEQDFHFSSFQRYMFFSSRSDLQQTNPNGDWAAPPKPGLKVTHLSWWNIPLQFSGYTAISRHDSVSSAAQQGDPLWALGQWLSGDFHIFKVLVILAGVPSLAYRVTDHNGRWFSNQSILKEINPGYSLEGLMLKLQYFGHLVQTADSLDSFPDAGKDWGQVEKGQQREMVGWHHWLNGHEFEQIAGNSEGPGSQVCGSRDSKESNMTAWLNNNSIVLKPKTAP